MDQLIKALALQNEVRVLLVRSDQLLNEAIERHDLWPSAASVLGKTLTIGLLMGAMLKEGSALTIKLNGNGPIGNVVVDASATGTVRGYVDQPHVHFSKLEQLDDELTLGGEGFIDVIKDLGLKDLFTSTVPLQFGEIAKDFTYYFAKSEQTSSIVSLGVMIGEDNRAIVSGGVIVQLLPKAKEETIKQLENLLPKLENISKQLLEQSSLEDLLPIWFKQDYLLIDQFPVAFHCPCNKEKFAGGIISLGAKDIKSLIDEQETAEITCHYCNEKYHFSKEELQDLLKEVTNE